MLRARKYQIKEELIKGLGELGYERPTPVQMQVIPCLLEKRNVIVTAPTGTGKTLSFLLPILNNLSESKKITAVIMVPLQELATQILEALRQLGAFAKVKFQCCSKLTEEEIAKIEGKKSPGYNILVATPLTFLRLFEERKVLLKQIEYVVLDECDKCIEECTAIDMQLSSSR
jgi:superfamily II DNA/RNA helicase